MQVSSDDERARLKVAPDGARSGAGRPMSDEWAAVFLDGTSVRAHNEAAGAEGGL